MKRIMVFILFAVIVTNISAHTGENVEYTCPICSKKFESYTQFSYTTFGQNLDLRRYGAAMIPSPIPKCTGCNFVFSNNLFTAEEINILKEELKVNNIFIREPDMPNYYYLAREAEIINRDLANIIWWFLSGVWENNDENKKRILINITIEYIDKLDETNTSYNNYQLVKLDLLRRSGQFDKAMTQIEKIKTNKDFYKNYIIRIIDLQIELIGNQNQEEHPLP
jgi:hypothetical protein